MKSYTDINQSKKLEEILPIDSADMHYNNASIKGINYVDEHRAELMEYNRAIKVLSKYTINPLFEVIPCWSLAALLEQLDDRITDEDGNDYNLTIIKEDLQYQLYYHDSWGQAEDIETNYYDDMVDACVEMILKLKEKNLL